MLRRARVLWIWKEIRIGGSVPDMNRTGAALGNHFSRSRVVLEANDVYRVKNSRNAGTNKTGQEEE